MSTSRKMAQAEVPAWQEQALRFRTVRDASMSTINTQLPDLSGDKQLARVIGVPRLHLTQAEVHLTESAPEVLVRSLAVGRVTAKEVVLAFLRRAAIAQKLANCVYELLPDRAVERAQELDDYLAQNGKPSGPLHGLPISVKEHISVAGRDNTAGFVGWIGNTSRDDASIIKILLDAGAVIYARTTEPQGLMAIETGSNITGVTVNPHNRALTCGGSSGGEAALLALRGSPLGIGSDIGGSIRLPAAHCGLYGFKPSSGRLPLMGVEAFCTGSDTIAPSIGPLSPTLEGIKLFMDTVLMSKPWQNDPFIHPLPWQSRADHLRQRGKVTLVVGVMWTDDVVQPAPPIKRALLEVVDKLKSTPGVEVIDWKPFQQTDALEILVSAPRLFCQLQAC
ncbi:Amidase [Purpureocillium takamizusanense]|uniref:amidase n=1 Tax=Purpureocillium takamizusanense TaxID=2060973 RepID=A0A9Q8QTT9_9HYPO|nr:Amidase [Purpureocillium takamizusanense]UNI24721.1 Amidase [Purpureocillium takamizusanense]